MNVSATLGRVGSRSFFQAPEPSAFAPYEPRAKRGEPHEPFPTNLSPGMAMWRERLFSSMSKNAVKASDFFHVPANRVVELGTQVEL